MLSISCQLFQEQVARNSDKGHKFRFNTYVRRRQSKMSIRYQSFKEPPPEGKTLLVGPMNSIWKDPSKPENKPREKLESEKGLPMPSWPTLLTMSASIAALTAVTHLRYIGRF